MPLQAPMPLHPFLAVEQSFWPLQAFTPSHWIFLASCACTVVTAVVMMRLAAAAASAAPVNLRFAFMADDS